MIEKTALTNTVDLLSIILGIILGIVVTVLLIKYIPVLIKKLKPANQIQKIQKMDSSDTFTLLRKHMLKKVQMQHLGPELCSLNDIYVPQFLYSHPLHANVAILPEEEPIFFLEALSVMDVPELACELPLPKLTLSQALSGRRNIALSGGIGAGKTTCLANLASEVLEKRCADTNLNDYLPLFFHITHLSPYSNLPLLDCLSRCLYDEGLDFPPPEIAKSLSENLGQSQLLLLVDGLDELRQAEFNLAVTLLQRLHKENPRVLMVTTCGPYYSGRLDAAGFSILPIIPPGQNEFRQGLSAWLKVWQSVNPSFAAGPSGSQVIDLITLWMNQDNVHPTYADFTFTVMSVLFRDYIPGSQTIVPYLQRKTEDKIPYNYLTRLAQLFSSQGNFSSSLHDAQNLFSTLPESKVGSPTETLNWLIECHVLSQTADQLRFTNSSILVRLLAQSDTHTSERDIHTLIHSAIDDQATKLSATHSEYVVKWLEALDPYDGRSLSIILSHMFSKRAQPAALSTTFPKLAKYIVSEQLPLSSKIKFATIINYANPVLFSQLLGKLETLPGKDCRKICAFFYSFLPLKQHESFLINILEDSQVTVALFGFLSLLISSDPRAAQLLLEVIESDPERYGRIISELSSQYPNTGHQLIRQLAHQENATLRRFSIYGLRLTVDKWATTMLDEISRTDSAWILRDAAAQALHDKYTPEIYTPQRLIRLVDNPLLVNAAVKRGVGIPANDYPYELLFSILESEKIAESLMALQYLLVRPNTTVVSKIKHLVAIDNPLREIASRAFHEFSMRE
ncbi:MAG: NACHT domain-containing protein [Anaerolineaceae bacterium]